LAASTKAVGQSNDDPTPLNAILSEALALVTFNGTLFDIPFLRKTVGELPIPSQHIDLRYAARTVGLTGGQKAIERELKLALRNGLDDIDGAGDGLRFPEDHAYFIERFSTKFVHLHIRAQQLVRQERSGSQGVSREQFEISERQPTELLVGKLEKLASAQITNEGSMSDFLGKLNGILAKFGPNSKKLMQN